MPTVDIVTIPVEPGTDVLNPDSAEAQAFAQGMQILERQEGFREAWYGHRIEDATKLMLLLNWESPGTHDRFDKSSHHEMFIKSLWVFLAGEPTGYLVQFVIGIREQFRAPITEIVEGRITEMTTELGADVTDLPEALLTSGAGLVCYSMGWSYEDVEREFPDGKGKICVLFLGWESAGAHMRARETEIYQNNIGGVEKHIKSMTAFQVAMKYYGKHA